MNSIRQLLAILLAAMVCLFMLSGEVSAKEPGSDELFEMSLEELMDVEVSVASRKVAKQNEVPGIVTIITRDEIRKSGARDLIDILRFVPGFDTSYDTYGAYGVSVRGIWANEGKVLILVDGLEMNEDLYNTFQYGHHIPMDIVERIEIMRGPGSVMYGESAELGVISITTISPETESEGFASATYSRTNKKFLRKEITGYYGMKKDDFSFSVASHYGRGNFSDRVAKNYDGIYGYDPAYYGTSVDLSENDNSLVESPFINVSLKKGNFSARYIHDRYRLNSVWPEYGDGKYHMRFYSDILEGKYQLPISDELSMTSKFTFKHNESWNYGEPTPSPGGDFVHVTSKKYKGENYFSYDLDGGHNIVVGASYEVITGHDNANVGGVDGANKRSYYNAAVYGEGFFKTPYGNLTIGGRQVKHNYAGDKFIPRAALTKQLGDYHIKAMYSQAYRTPNMRVISERRGGVSFIKPEHTTIYEFEVGKQMTENWLITANIFDVEINDPIIYYAAGYANYEKTGSRGIEVSSLYKKGTSSLRMAYSYYLSRENEVGPYAVPGHRRDHAGIANHKFSLLASFSPYKNVFITPSLTYHSSKYGIVDWYNVDGDYAYDKLDPTLIADLSLLFKDLFNKEGMDLSFTIHNLFDETMQNSQCYQDYYGPMPGPSRAFTMNLRYTF